MSEPTTSESTKAEQKKTDGKDAPFPPPGAATRGTLNLPSGELDYRAVAEWLTLRKIHKPVGHIFHTAYLADTDDPRRPLTFVFNGGPGAASAYLHMGAVGPKRVAFGPDGTLPRPPAQVDDNQESWLRFTDLCFIDPIGTGFSRALQPEKPKDKAKEGDAADAEAPKENAEFWDIDKDLESLGEFIGRFLSKHNRWTAPIFVAGESYGGFRAAKMARKLQEDHGVGLNGAVLISPAIELDSLMGTDYDLTYWVELFPSLAGAAWHHGRATAAPGATLESVLAAAEAFATTELPQLLVQGAAATERQGIIDRMAALLGLPAELVDRSAGRITSTVFCRQLLRDQRRLLGHYDASISAVDPFPDRDDYAGPDPTLFSIDRLFTSAVNHHLRTTLGVDTDLDYRLLSLEVNSAWKDSARTHVFQRTAGAMDDLRYGMSLNEHMRVFIAHGYFDLVTPYFASRRLVDQMKLTESQHPLLETANYAGGHMFYSWDASRAAFTADMARFYEAATA